MIASVDRLFTAPVQRDPLGLQRTGNGMSGGNGADLGQVLAMLGDLLVGQGALDRRMEQLERRMDQLEYRLGQLESQVEELANQVAAYHGAVVAHGVLIRELEERLRRVEQDPDSLRAT
jgi:uncharacterized coiled-coil protein SlyX